LYADLATRKYNIYIKQAKRLEGIIIEQIIRNTVTEKRTYSVSEIMEILEIGRNKAYELCNSNLFRIVRIGKTIRVSKLSFDTWLDNNE